MPPQPQLVIDVTGVGTPVSDLFERGLLNPHLVQVVAGEEMGQELTTYRVPKKELVSTAQILLQTSRLRIARGLALPKLLVRELSTFQMKMGLKEDEPTFGREGAANDLVPGLSIALRLAERQNGGISVVIYVGRSEFGNGLMF
jgi:hypothetical protein